MAEPILRLKVESQEYDAKIKRAAEGLERYVSGCRKVGGTLEVVEKETLDYVKAIGQMETNSRNATGRLVEMKRGFTEFSVIYKNLTEEEKKGDFGRGLSASLDQLKARIENSKKELADVSKELGETGKEGLSASSVIDTLGHKFGVTANLTDLLTSKTAMLTGVVGAMATGVVAATKEWAAYNDELAKQDQQTTVITGLNGSDSNNMTDSARALASVYNVDFRQAIDAANTLMTQFGESGDSAMQILRDGMQGMLQGDGGKLLQMIQQYAPAFHDAGVSASQLVAVIQNSEGGIFTAENMSAIVMGIKNIRLMTNQTREALAKMGIDGEEMSKKMSDGSMTIFDALKQVASKLKDTEAGSKTAGEVMQSVFGRQGAMAGTNLAKAIESLNTNLDETKTQTGEIGQATADLQKATEQLNKAIRDCFEYDGWDVMKTELQTGIVVALATVVEKLSDAKRYLTELEVAGVNVFETIRTSALNALGPLGKVLNLLIDINNAKSGGKAGAASEHGGALSGALLGKNGGGTPTESPQDVYKNVGVGGGAGAALEKETTIQQQIAELEKEALTATDQRREAIHEQILELDEVLRKQKEITESLHAPKDDIGALYPQLDVSDQQGGTPTTPFEKAQNDMRIQIAEQNVEVDQNTFTSLLQVAVQNGLESLSPDFTSFQEKLAEGLDIPDDKWEEFTEKINEQLAELGIDPINIDLKTGDVKTLTNDTKEMSAAWKSAASAVSSAGAAMKQIDDPAAKIAGIVAEAIASIALGYANASSQASEMGPWVWLAFAAAGLATTLTTIAQIKQATAGSYAEGGIIPGNSFSGDLLTANVNSGELILNRAQQGAIADQLTAGDSVGNVSDDAVVRVAGEDLLIVMNTALRRRGFGQLALGDFN